MMKANRTNIAGIETLTVLGEDPSVAVIMLHGYGANMNDLFPLWELWHEEKFNWYFPNGVLPLPMGYYEGRSWFSIDMEKLEKAMREGTHRDMKGSVPPELDTTLQMLEHFVSEVSKKHKTVILGGFSQGAMCTSHLAMKESLKLDGIVLLSGALLAEDKFPKAARALPFYQSHGTQDPILSIDGARDLEKKLHSMNFTGKLHEFRGGHEIPASVIHEVKIFLKQFV
ncbi:alpha/beta hydrolase [Peredibacter starrii]|uniref:Dienelactone hydrolase family protein n=1 Tax=Peredibacter starrii TaxID=28202 RepID=A0AAX4HJD4_9BACT|nr:dienelactone hydrolase family protein [Peredibacter starrii]WPU63317.1 dienelactone hydrolase family protein [Peredibacter starrii]